MQEVPSRLSHRHRMPDLEVLCPSEGAINKLVTHLSFQLRAKELMASMPHISTTRLISSKGFSCSALPARKVSHSSPTPSDRAHDASADLTVAALRRAVGQPCLDPDRTPAFYRPFCRKAPVSGSTSYCVCRAVAADPVSTLMLRQCWPIYMPFGVAAKQLVLPWPTSGLE